jgi:hypothetical protein
MATKRTIIIKKEPESPHKTDRKTDLVKRLGEKILRNAGGSAQFKKAAPLLLRCAIDEVIDTPRTGRSTLDETKINERIYLATKVKLRLKSLMKLPSGKVLDLETGEIQVGIQSTIGRTWYIPRAIVGYPCILIRCDVNHSLCSVGVIEVRDDCLSASQKSSGRRMISRTGLARVHWILKDEPLPDIPRQSSD